MMKRFFVLVWIVAAGFFNCEAQFVTLPDTAFVNWLKSNGYAACFNGNLLDTACSAVLTATSLDCSVSAIHNLNGIQYFKQLATLNCHNDSLNSIPALPLQLKFLNCSFNQLTGLPTLPASLQTLQCYNNQLSSLPNFPQALRDIECGKNQLTFIPALPDTLDFFKCENNPNLNCLPLLTNILVLDFVGTNVACLPNHSSTGISYPALDTIPLCNTFNPNGCDITIDVNQPKSELPGLDLYPNPASDYVIVSVNNDLVGHWFLLYDATGKCLFKLQISASIFNLKTSALAKGQYYATFENRTRVAEMRKLAIQ